MEELDEFFSTPDEHFNQTAQYWYFEFTGTAKPKSSHSIITFLKALKQSYFFILENSNTPVKCVNTIESICKEKQFTKVDCILLIDKLLSMLFIGNDDKNIKVYLQLIDHRMNIEPFEIDPNFIKNTYKFDIETIKQELNAIESLDDKRKFLVHKILDFNASYQQMDFLELQYYDRIGLTTFFLSEIQRLSFDIKSTKQPKHSDKPTAKPFHSYLIHPKKKSLAKKLKEEFKNDKGKTIRFMFEVLKDYQPSIISYEDRQRRKILEAMQLYFGTDIGTYQSVWNYPYDSKVNEIDYISVKKRIDPILNILAS